MSETSKKRQRQTDEIMQVTENGNTVTQNNKPRLTLDIKSVRLVVLKDKSMGLQLELWPSKKSNSQIATIPYEDQSQLAELRNSQIQTDKYTINGINIIVEEYQICGTSRRRLFVSGKKPNKNGSMQNNSNKKGAFSGFFIGKSGRERTKKGNHYVLYKFISDGGEQVVFRGYKQAFARFCQILKKSKEYKITNYQFKNGQYILTIYSKAGWTGREIAAIDLFNVCQPLVPINKLMSKNLETKQVYNLFAKVISQRSISYSTGGKMELLVSDGTGNILVHIWGSDRLFRIQDTSVGRYVLLLGCQISTNLQENYVSKYFHIIDGDAFSEISSKHLDTVRKVDVKKMIEYVQEKPYCLVNAAGTYDQWRCVYISQLLDVDWSSIRVKQIDGYNLFDKFGNRDQSISIIIKGSILSLDCGTSNMIYPVERLEEKVLYRKLKFHLDEKKHYNWNSKTNRMEYVSQVAYRWNVNVRITDSTSTLDVKMFDSSFQQLLALNDIKVTADEYAGKICKGTNYEGLRIGDFDITDVNCMNPRLVKLFDTIRNNYYVFGINATPPQKNGYSSSYVVQSVALLNFDNEIMQLKQTNKLLQSMLPKESDVQR